MTLWKTRGIPSFFLLLVALVLPQTSFGQKKQTQTQTAPPKVEEVEPVVVGGDCLCPGEYAQLVADYVWQDAALYGFAENATCYDIEQLFVANGCNTDPGALREICCVDLSRPRYVCANNVRNYLFGGNNYDKYTLPSTSLFHDSLQVQVKLDYQTVTDIDIAAGTTEIFAWFTLTWRDPRLAWSYDANTTCTNTPIHVTAHAMTRLSEIWVPDIDLINRVSGTKQMESGLAVVSNDGTVIWRREGKLKAMCNLKNLGNIPFDELGCQFMFAGTHQAGIEYVLDYKGAVKVGSFNSPYVEYKLLKAIPGIHRHVVSGFELQFLFVDFYFTRGTKFYAQTILVNVAIYAVMSTIIIILGFNSFQRIATTLTLLLVSVAQKISTSNLLPITDFRLWLVDFVNVSSLWIALALFENAFVAAMLYMREKRDDEKKKQQEQEEKEEEVIEFETTNEELPMSVTTTTYNNGGGGRVQEPTADGELTEWFFTFSLRKFDVACFVLLLLSYLIFIVYMLAKRNNWGSDVTNNFLLSNITSALFLDDL